MATPPEDTEDTSKTLMFFGTDLAKIPCFRESFMAGIGSGLVSGLVYNLAFSRNPFRVAFITYGVVTFGYYAQCRYSYRLTQHEMRQIKHAMKQRVYQEGTENDAEWAASALEKQTNERNFRSDADES